MTTFLVITVTSLGLASLYFLTSSGLSLIFGLMDVLNIAHGAFFGLGGYAAWLISAHLALPSLWLRFAVALIGATVTGLVIGWLMEKLLVARNYGDHLAQILVTLGLALAFEGLMAGLFDYAPRRMTLPEWFGETTTVAGAQIPNSRFLIIALALAVLALILWFIHRTKFGLVLRAGVENRSMVRALGIDVERTFTIVFALGAALAALGGSLGVVFYNGVTPTLGQSQLIFAFIVVIVGGLGSIVGTAVASVIVAFLQQSINFYGAAGLGDFAVVALLAVVVLVRPQGLLGRKS